MRTGVTVALGSAALFRISTPLAKMLVGSVSPLMLAGLLYAGSGLGLMLVLLGRRLFIRTHRSHARNARIGFGLALPYFSVASRGRWR